MYVARIPLLRASSTDGQKTKHLRTQPASRLLTAPPLTEGTRLKTVVLGGRRCAVLFSGFLNLYVGGGTRNPVTCQTREGSSAQYCRDALGPKAEGRSLEL
jgi:hypothetical protein